MCHAAAAVGRLDAAADFRRQLVVFSAFADRHRNSFGARTSKPCALATISLFDMGEEEAMVTQREPSNAIPKNKKIEIGARSSTNK